MSNQMKRKLQGHYETVATADETVQAFVPAPLTPATINKTLSHLQELGIVRELTWQKRNRLFSYAHYIKILNSGTNLPEQNTIEENTL